MEALNSRIGELRETRFNIEELTDRLGQDIGAAQLGIEIGKGGLKGTKAAKKVTGQSIPKVNKAGKKVKTLEDIGKVKNTGSGGGVMASKDGLLLEQVQVPKQLQKTTAKPKEKVSTTTKEKQALETRQKQKAAMKQKAANKSKLIQSINAANIFAATQVQGLNVMQRQLIVPLQSTKQIQGQAQATKQKREQKQRIAYAAKSMQVAIPTVKQKQQQTVREITRQEPKQAERTLTDSIAVPRSVWRSKAETLPPVAAPMPKRSKKSKKSYDMGVIHKTSKNAFKDIWELI
ncbi:MAG: hypothetical protein A4E24_01746 [Methanomethylovorans sp. PtaU1.Bin093]|nr:MAG: hypothetical protein A4E24_01746 [Methanomethylovorans sp. PtaU1.Bin093]